MKHEIKIIVTVEIIADTFSLIFRSSHEFFVPISKQYNFVSGVFYILQIIILSPMNLNFVSMFTRFLFLFW